MLGEPYQSPLQLPGASPGARQPCPDTAHGDRHSPGLRESPGPSAPSRARHRSLPRAASRRAAGAWGRARGLPSGPQAGPGPGCRRRAVRRNDSALCSGEAEPEEPGTRCQGERGEGIRAPSHPPPARPGPPPPGTAITPQRSAQARARCARQRGQGDRGTGRGERSGGEPRGEGRGEGREGLRERGRGRGNKGRGAAGQTDGGRGAERWADTGRGTGGKRDPRGRGARGGTGARPCPGRVPVLPSRGLRCCSGIAAPERLPGHPGRDRGAPKAHGDLLLAWELLLGCELSQGRNSAFCHSLEGPQTLQHSGQLSTLAGELSVLEEHGGSCCRAFSQHTRLRPVVPLPWSRFGQLGYAAW